MVRKNFVLIYEVLDEMLDFGYPQIMKTSEVHKLVESKAMPLVSDSVSSNSWAGVIPKKSKGSDATKVGI